MPEGAVIWDIDGTIISSSLERRFVAYLRDKRITTDDKIAKNFWRLLWGWSLPRWHRVKACYLRDMAVARADELMSDCFEAEIKPAIRPSVPETISELDARGWTQVLLSGTLQPLADLVAEYLGVREVVAAQPEITSGRYTGRLTAPVARGRHKLWVAEKWLAEQGLTWQDTVCVADHWGDRHILYRAAAAATVSPDQWLWRRAHRRAWLIIDRPDAPEAFAPVLEIAERVRAGREEN